MDKASFRTFSLNDSSSRKEGSSCGEDQAPVVPSSTTEYAQNTCFRSSTCFSKGKDQPAPGFLFQVHAIGVQMHIFSSAQSV